MKREEYKRDLWQEYVENADYIERVWKEGVIDFGENFLNGNVTFLYEVYQAFIDQERFRIDEQRGIEYEKDQDLYFIRYQGEEWSFEYKPMKELLERSIGIFEDMLPLGSVVDLKKEFLQKGSETELPDTIRMVIVQRYVGESPEGFYYPYAGAVYPIGNPGNTKLLEFTPALIQTVVSRGYSDEQEEAYQYLMKQEVFLHRGLHSMGFADEEERSAYQKFVERRG